MSETLVTIRFMDGTFEIVLPNETVDDLIGGFKRGAIMMFTDDNGKRVFINPNQVQAIEIANGSDFDTLQDANAFQYDIERQ